MTPLKDALTELVVTHADRRQEAINEFVAEHWPLVQRVGTHLWRHFGHIAHLPSTDFATIAGEHLFRIVNRVLDEPGYLDGIENIEQVWRLQCYNDTKAWIRDETHPLSGMGRRVEVQAKIRQLYWQMYQTNEAEPTVNEVIKAHNAEMLKRRKDAHRQGMIASEADYTASMSALSLDSPLHADTEQEPGEFELPAIPAEADTGADYEGVALFDRIVDECYVLSANCGIAAQMVLPNLAGGDSERVAVTKLARTSGLKPSEASDLMRQIMAVARWVGSHWRDRTQESHASSA